MIPIKVNPNNFKNRQFQQRNMNMNNMNNMNNLQHRNMNNMNNVQYRNVNMNTNMNTNINNMNNLQHRNTTNNNNINTNTNINHTNNNSQPQPTKKKYETLKPNELIDFAYNNFKEIYKTHISLTNINSIIKGELIQTSPDNIFVDEDNTFDDPKWNNKIKFINKKLYNYQELAIKKIRQLELSPERIIKNNENKIVSHIKSNGWLLHLPIGSGKSLVFTFLSIMYRTVPKHPIIVSTSGINIPDTELLQFRDYPYYYENVGYDELTENSAITFSDYQQRPMTVIITHFHLMDQLNYYIQTDFKRELLKQTKICFATSPTMFDLNADILIVPAQTNIIQALVKLSYESPFMRVIIDDFTNMSGVEEYRQILASSSLFVSGSGFERDKSKIPPSYYTLRHIDINKYSLVAQ